MSKPIYTMQFDDGKYCSYDLSEIQQIAQNAEGVHIYFRSGLLSIQSGTWSPVALQHFIHCYEKQKSGSWLNSPE